MLTGTVPHKDKADLAVIHTVVFRREHPARPIDCIPPKSAKGDELWNMLERCWSHEPRLRPRVTKVRDFVSAKRILVDISVFEDLHIDHFGVGIVDLDGSG